MANQLPPRYRSKGGQSLSDFWVENKIASWLPDVAVEYIRKNPGIDKESTFGSPTFSNPQYRKNGNFLEVLKSNGTWGRASYSDVERAFSGDTYSANIGKLDDNEKMMVLRSFLGIDELNDNNEFTVSFSKNDNTYQTDGNIFFESIVDNGWSRLIQSKLEEEDKRLAELERNNKIQKTIARPTVGREDKDGNYIPTGISPPPIGAPRMIGLDLSKSTDGSIGEPIFEENIVADICTSLKVPVERWPSIAAQMTLNSNPNSTTSGVGGVRVEDGEIIGAKPFGLGKHKKNSEALYYAKKYGAGSVLTLMGMTSFAGSIPLTPLGTTVIGKLAASAFHLGEHAAHVVEPYLVGIKTINALINPTEVKAGDVEGLLLKNPVTPVLMYIAAENTGAALAAMGVSADAMLVISALGGPALLFTAAYLLWEKWYDTRKEEEKKLQQSIKISEIADDLDESLPGNQSVMRSSLTKSGGKWAIVLQPETTVTQIIKPSAEIVQTITVNSVKFDGSYKIPIGVEPDKNGILRDVYPQVDNYHISIEQKNPDGTITVYPATPGRTPIVTKVPPIKRQDDRPRESWERIGPSGPLLPKFDTPVRQDNTKPKYSTGQMPLVGYNQNQNGTFRDMDRQVVEKYTNDKQNSWVESLNNTKKNNKQGGLNTNNGPETATGPTKLPSAYNANQAMDQLNEMRRKDIQSWISLVNEWNYKVIQDSKFRVPLADNNIGINNTGGNLPNGKITVGKPFYDRIINGQRYRIWYEPATGEELYRYKFQNKNPLIIRYPEVVAGFGG